MRKLGQELGVEAMSLYNHVQNKDDVLSGAVDLVTQEFDLAADERDWRAGLRRCAISVHDTLFRHGWVAGLWWRSGSGTPRMAYADAVLARFREAGFAKEVTYHAYHTFEGYVVGFTLQQVNFHMDEETLAEAAEGFLRNFPKEQYPDLWEHVQQHLEPHDDGNSFELGLDLILDGFERLLTLPAGRRKRPRRP
jgi:AcrR family transcriptional regulator